MRTAAAMAAVDAAPADPAAFDGYTAPAAIDPHAVAFEWVLSLYESHVEEPPGQGWRAIDDMIRGELGLDWTTADPSFKTRVGYSAAMMKFQWCGAILARALGSGGLRRDIRFNHMASTGRLYRFAKGTDRMVALTDLRLGDVLMVGARRKRKGRVLVEGEHFAMVEHVEGGMVHTIEGNAIGLGPDGRVFEGVIRRTRPLPKSAGGPGWSSAARCTVSGERQLMEVMHAVRFGAEDFGNA